jgi:hypothetical protein
MLTHRLGRLIPRIFVRWPKGEHDRREAAERPELRDATDAEIDESIDASFPASDPPALHLEKDL